MSKKRKQETSKAAMALYEQNGEVVQELLNGILDLVPDGDDKAKAMGLASELETRMFYADYLCDVNGRCYDLPWGKGIPVKTYNDIRRTMKKVAVTGSH